MRKINRKEVKEKILDAAIAVRNILEKNKIRHFITFGTLLGAVRHRGFIPWDDDFDIFIHDDDYIDAIAYLEKYLPPHLIIHDQRNDKRYFKAWSMIKDINSSVEFSDWCSSDSKKLKYKSINIDLFRIKEMRLADVENYLRDEEAAFHLRHYKCGFTTDNQAIERVKHCYSSAYKHKYASLYGLEEQIKNSSKSAKVLMNMIMMKYPINYDDIFPLKKNLDFEGEFFYSPNKPNVILECCYGNYLQLPEMCDRKYHYKSVKYSN